MPSVLILPDSFMAAASRRVGSRVTNPEVFLPRQVCSLGPRDNRRGEGIGLGPPLSLGPWKGLLPDFSTQLLPREVKVLSPMAGYGGIHL